MRHIIRYICINCNKEVKLPKTTKKYMNEIRKKNITRKLFCPSCGKDDVKEEVIKNEA